jgi:hypothetical protein
MTADRAKAERLAQALRANLRRRKAAVAGEPSAVAPSAEDDARDPSPREPLPDKPRT